jgi:hypothetical protein
MSIRIENEQKEKNDAAERSGWAHVEASILPLAYRQAGIKGGGD